MSHYGRMIWLLVMLAAMFLLPSRRAYASLTKSYSFNESDLAHWSEGQYERFSFQEIGRAHV